MKRQKEDIRNQRHDGVSGRYKGGQVNNESDVFRWVIERYGDNSATYSTDSLLVQQAIENSDQFKRGRIRIISEIDLDGEIEVLHGGDIPADKDDKDIGIDTPPDTGGIDAQEVNISCNGMAGDGSGVIEVEFDNNDDARDYLEREFGYIRSKLRVRADIIAAGEANGVKIEFSK